MEINNDLIDLLREMARRNQSISEMVHEICVREALDIDNPSALTVDRYFWKAFQLPLRQVRDLEAWTFLGGSLYSDSEIDKLMLPRIADNRSAWDPSSVECS